MPSNRNIHFSAQFYPSRYLMGILLLLHVALLLLLMQLPIQWWAQGLIGVVLAFSLYHYCRRYGYYKSSHSIVAIQYQEAQWQLQTRQGDWVAVELLDDTVVTQSLIILHAINTAKKKYNVTLFKDAVSAAAWHDLQFLLRRHKKLP